MKYELEEQKQTMYELISSRSFGESLLKITKKELFFAFDMTVEIEKNKSRGFPWYVGTQTFAIQMLENFGCTVWVPLEKSAQMIKLEGSLAFQKKLYRRVHL